MKTPIDIVKGNLPNIEDAISKSLLGAYSDGLRDGAKFVADVCDEIARDQTPPGDAPEDWKPAIWTPDQAHALGKVLARINDRLMAHLKAAELAGKKSEG